jgi:hypothetical protein
MDRWATKNFGLSVSKRVRIELNYKLSGNIMEVIQSSKVFTGKSKDMINERAQIDL